MVTPGAGRALPTGHCQVGSGGLSPAEGISGGSRGPRASVSPTRPPGGRAWASACWQSPCRPPGLAGTQLVVREVVTRSGHRRVGSSALVMAGQPRPGLCSSRQTFCPPIPCPWEVRAVHSWEPPDEVGDPLGRVLPPALILSATDGAAGGWGTGRRDRCPCHQHGAIRSHLQGQQSRKK